MLETPTLAPAARLARSGEAGRSGLLVQATWAAHEASMCVSEDVLGPPVAPFYPRGGEVPLLKKGTQILTDLLEDLVLLFSRAGFTGNLPLTICILFFSRGLKQM